jgi:hypothetical protein
VRKTNPARVVYVVDTSLDDDPETGLELHFDSAYWVSGIRARDPASLASVDVTSLALPRFEETVERIDRMLDNVSAGRDLCGPNPEVRPETTGASARSRSRRALPRERRRDPRGARPNVAAVAFDVSSRRSRRGDGGRGRGLERRPDDAHPRRARA